MPSVNPSNVNGTNTVGVGGGIFSALKDLFLSSEAANIGAKLKAIVANRAKVIVDTGAFTSLEGMEGILHYQTKSIADLNGKQGTIWGSSHDDLSNVT